MTNANDMTEDNYQEYDEFDDEEERGLSGFMVLIMGIIMIGAFVSVVWIAYQQGIKAGGGVPYVAADPEPIKIETAEDETQAKDREVYDVFDGEKKEPVAVLTQGPEEPVDRASDDTIGTIAAGADEATNNQIEGQLANLSQQDAAALNNKEPVSEEPAPAEEEQAPVDERPIVRVAPAPSGALDGSYVVQVGAFRSEAEAEAQWARIQAKLGDYLSGKSYDIERADLGDRGVYHRLRIGPFNSSDDAKTYCAGLKERGQDCLIKGV